MCGRFTLDIDKRFYPRFKLNNVIQDIVPRFNISPGQYSPVIFTKDNKTNIVELMKWGLIPFFSDTEKSSYTLINAKLETIDKKHILKKSKKCIIPVSGFYEWKAEKDIKQPYYITTYNNEYIAFAGIYDIWEDKKNNNKIACFSIITTKPNFKMKDLHDRMPFILNIDNEDEWIRDNIGYDELNELSYKEDLNIYKVKRDVNSPLNDSKDLITPL